MAEQQELLALLVFIGGLSAASGMVIVETIALSTMVCNDLLMPILLRLPWLKLNRRNDLTGLLLGIRRGAIVLILLLGYLYFRLAGEAYALVSIGLISFAAVAQFAPAMFGGIFWKGGTRRGALCGLLAGFAVWFYTLLLPAIARSGWLPIGLLGERAVRHRVAQPAAAVRAYPPRQHHACHDLEHDRQHRRLRDRCRCRARRARTSTGRRACSSTCSSRAARRGEARFWRGTASVPDLYELLARFVGSASAESAINDYARSKGLHDPENPLRGGCRVRPLR